MIILEDDEILTDEQLLAEEDALPELTFESTEEPVDEPTDENELPEKYRGKDLSDVVRMHQEAEKQIGKQSSEVGELRGVVDSYIKTQFKPTEPVVEEEFDFFDDPDKASKIRTKLYEAADTGYDTDAADELFTNWKERKGIVEQTVKLEKATRKDSIKRASTGSTRGTGETSRKVYRRSDLIKLMQEDPDRYEANADEIMLAYAEKRVR